MFDVGPELEGEVLHGGGGRRVRFGQESTEPHVQVEGESDTQALA